VTRRRRPRALVAVVVVALLACACGIPAAGGPTAISKADVPFDLGTPTTSTTMNPTVSPSVAVPETIYLVAPDQHLLAVSRDVTVPATLTQVLAALLDGPTSAESAFGLQSFLTGTRTKVRATVADGVATVDFSVNPVQVVGPDQTMAVAQVVFTATMQPGVKAVLFQIDSQPIAVPTASGVLVAAPVDQSSYQPQAPLP
jgi:spore germination protein GerM